MTLSQQAAVATPTTFRVSSVCQLKSLHEPCSASCLPHRRLTGLGPLQWVTALWQDETFVAMQEEPGREPAQRGPSAQPARREGRATPGQPESAPVPGSCVTSNG